MRNNSSYRNLSIFELKFDLKSQGNFCELKSKKIHWKNVGTLDFSEIWPGSSWLHLIGRKNEFPTKGYQKFEFQSKREIRLILNFIFKFHFWI
jgi:hypothetical protein